MKRFRTIQNVAKNQRTELATLQEKIAEKEKALEAASSTSGEQAESQKAKEEVSDTDLRLLKNLEFTCFISLVAS